MNIITFSSVEQLNAAFAPTSKGQLSPVVMATTNQNAKSPNTDENPSKDAPTNVSILVSGNAANAATAIKKSNMNISHACDSSMYVGKAVTEVGAKAGQLMRALRQAVKLALDALGINAAASAISSQFKKITQFIKNIEKFINDIKKYVMKYIEYLNMIKDLIGYLLSLPARLLTYFSDCVLLLQKQLSAGFLDNLKLATGDGFSIDNTIREVTVGLGALNTSINVLTASSNDDYASSPSFSDVSSSNTTVQAEATTAVFESAGFYDTSQNYGAKP